MFVFFFKESGKVTHNLTLQTATRSSAVASEKEAFVTLYTAAKEIFNLRSVTTDGNMSIRAFMRGEDGVKHGLDVWYLSKNLGKNLARKAKTAVSACCFVTVVLLNNNLIMMWYLQHDSVDV